MKRYIKNNTYTIGHIIKRNSIGDYTISATADTSQKYNSYDKYIVFTKGDEPTVYDIYLNEFPEYINGVTVIITNTGLTAFSTESKTYIYDILDTEIIKINDIVFDTSPLNSYNEDNTPLNSHTLTFSVDSSNNIKFNYRTISSNKIEIDSEYINGSSPDDNGLHTKDSWDEKTLQYAYKQSFQLRDSSGKIREVKINDNDTDKFSFDGLGKCNIDLSNKLDLIGTVLTFSFVCSGAVASGILEVV